MSKAAVRTLQLAAFVKEGKAASTLTRAELAGIWNVDVRTVRAWEKRGLPVVHGKDGPRYPLPEATWWIGNYRQLQRQRRAPALLQLEDLIPGEMAFQMRGDPEGFVIVPLDWDHPFREQCLRQAAAGRKPPEASDA